jgi:delta-aminolevulinic acid dehydratase/porphobilinogen synthase
MSCQRVKSSQKRRFIDRFLLLAGLALEAYPSHGRCGLVFEKESLQGLMIQTALRHQLSPANLLIQMRLNPRGQLIELFF